MAGRPSLLDSRRNDAEHPLKRQSAPKLFAPPFLRATVVQNPRVRGECPISSHHDPRPRRSAFAPRLLLLESTHARQPDWAAMRVLRSSKARRRLVIGL